MSYRERYQYILTFTLDMMALVLSVAVSRHVFGAWLQLIPIVFEDKDYLQFYLVLALVFLIVFLCFDQEKDIARRTMREEILRSIGMNFLMAAGSALVMIVVKMPLADSRYFFLGIFFLNTVLELIFHRGIKIVLQHISQRKSMTSLVGILTVSDRAIALLDDLRKDWTKDLCGIALIDGDETQIGKKIVGVPVKAGFTDFMEWVRREALDEVYIDVPYDTGNSLEGYLLELESMGLSVHFSVPLLEKLYGDDASAGWRKHIATNLEKRGKSFLIGISTVHRSIRDQILKRVIDILGALIGLIISVPIIAITAIPLKIESQGPIFFKQKRVGLNGRFFYIYKLRSMYIDAEARKQELMSRNEMDGLMFKMTDDPRITKVGKFIRKTSIDELPQFWNVLRGEMSLVGTRPPTVDEYEQYESHHKRRLSMKPGITGMWQVSGRSSIENFEEVVRLDTKYIDNWSFRLDAEILLRTIAVVFARRGAK